jgi:hypothetical protein
MKKLTNTYFLACAFTLLMFSCGKDPLPSNRTLPIVPPPAPQPQPEVLVASITSTTADLTLYVHSTLPLSTPYNISIPGVFDEQFDFQDGPKKTWKLSNLRPGTYRVTLRYSESAIFPYFFFTLNFEITDSNGTQRLIPSQLGPRTYAFDLQVKN